MGNTPKHRDYPGKRSRNRRVTFCMQPDGTLCVRDMNTGKKLAVNGICSRCRMHGNWPAEACRACGHPAAPNLAEAFKSELQRMHEDGSVGVSNAD